MNSEITEITEAKEERPFHRCDGLASVSVEPTAWREAAAPWADSFRGWILYDGNCRSCAASAKKFERIFRRRGFLFLPLQTNWIMKRLGLKPGAPLEEMRVLTSDDRDISGADAVVFLGRQIWWAWPFAALARLPGIHKLLDRGYRWIAAHRGCDHVTCNLALRRRWPGWIALIVLPLLALLLQNHAEPWQFMWLMTAAIFLGCKWLTFWSAPRQSLHVRVSRALAYFFLWPGMDAKRFFRLPKRKNLTVLNGQTSRGAACEVRVAQEQELVLGPGEKLSGNMPDRARTLGFGAGEGSDRMPALPITAAIAKMLIGVVLLFGVARVVHQPLLTG